MEGRESPLNTDEDCLGRDRCVCRIWVKTTQTKCVAQRMKVRVYAVFRRSSDRETIHLRGFDVVWTALHQQKTKDQLTDGWMPRRRS